LRIIAFTGYSGAGKSETSMRINRLFGYPIIESRPILKKIARENGFQRARECIPAIGFERFFSEGRKRTVDIINSTNDFLKPDKVIIADLFDRKLFKYLKEKNVGLFSCDNIKAGSGKGFDCESFFQKENTCLVE